MDRMCWRRPRRRRCLRNSAPTCLRSFCAWSGLPIASPRSSLVTSTSGRWCPRLHAYLGLSLAQSLPFSLSLLLSLSLSLLRFLSLPPPPSLKHSHNTHAVATGATCQRQCRRCRDAYQWWTRSAFATTWRGRTRGRCCGALIWSCIASTSHTQVLHVVLASLPTLHLHIDMSRYLHL